MKRPLAYITAHWGDCTEDNMKLAAKYCRSVYDAGYQPICPMMMHTLFLRDAIPQEHKDSLDMSKDYLIPADTDGFAAIHSNLQHNFQQFVHLFLPELSPQPIVFNLLTLMTIPLVGFAMKVFGRKLKSSSTVIQERVAEITSLLQESISAIRVVKSFVRESYEIKRFEEQNWRNFQAAMKNVKLSSLLTPTVEFLAAIAVTFIVWFGGYEVVNGVITAGELVAFLTYAVNLANPVKRLSRVYAAIQKAMAAADRVFNIMDLEEKITDVPGAKPLPPIKGKVEFKDITFSYKEGQPALQHISLKAEPGQMIALVGPSGSGKSTIANLIPRFYDVDSGVITIDDHDIRQVTADSLREQIGLVPQETMLFSTSVMENIRYGRLEATDEEVIEAAKAANAEEFIKELPEGYDTKLGERGLNLSGGQRQRLAIARAILKNPRVLILDEATSALDTESEKIVQDALDNLMVGRTSFVIAHRLSTIFNADQIFVVENGHLREHGTHEELLAAGGLYSNLYNIQFRQNQEG